MLTPVAIRKLPIFRRLALGSYPELKAELATFRAYFNVKTWDLLLKK